MKSMIGKYFNAIQHSIVEREKKDHSLHSPKHNIKSMARWYSKLELSKANHYTETKGASLK